MTSKQQTTTKPDFSNYAWFPGKNDRFNAASVSLYEGRVFLGLKGFDKKTNGSGYIQAEFDYEQIKALHERLGEILAAPVSADSEEE